MIANLTRGEALLELVNHLCYDALTIGNHEPDYGSRVLAERMEQARFPVIADVLVMLSRHARIT